jgi:type I restriction-modification system DNA methylase subunit
MSLKYKCGICESKPDQLSHHKMHIDTQKHKDRRTIFELKLQSMTNEALVENYKTHNINEIININETKKIIKIKKKIKEKTEMDSKKTISGNTIWNLEINQDLNPNYASIKSKLDSIIKQCHNLLYGKGGSIVGTKAQNDIMRILCLKILQSQFNDENSELWDRCNKVKSYGNMPDPQFAKFKSYCNDITKITKKDNVFKEWRDFVNKFLSKVFPSIYYENDNKFHCDKSQCIIELIKIIDSLDIDEEFKDAFSTTCGDIHESFRSYGGKNSGAKALGQFFTPRHLIHLMFHGIGLDKLIEPIEDITIYDPCMGTGGFLTRLFKMCSIPSENIYGCETEIDTIKFGEMSMVLTTGNSRNNIIKCDSLCENRFILDKKFSAIVTNPPFGTSMKYQDLKETYEKKFPDSPVKFEDIYPLKTNNGACLFVQHCVYMLAEGGFCAIVLPDGELFEGNSKWSKTFRKWLSEHVNIRTILKVASGTFEHAGVKTNVVVFTKDGPTQNIHFMETPKECNVVKDMFTISAEELKTAGYSLDVGEYLVEETDNYDVPMVPLRDLFTIEYGSKNPSVTDNDNVYPSISGGSKISKYTNEWNIPAETILIARSGSCGSVNKFNTNCLMGSYGFFLSKKNGNYNNEYIYQYLKFYQSNIKNLARGTAVKNLNREKLYDFKIPIPSLEVQQQIVDELSQIETSIETIESRIAQLKREKDQYKKYGRKAEIRELLKDSEEKMLGEVCKISQGSSISGKDRIKGDIPYYGSNGVIDYLDKIQFEGEYIITGRVGTLGKYHYINGSFSLCDNAFYMKPYTDNLKIKYLYLYSKFVFVNKFNNTSGPVPSFNRTKFNSFKIPLPSQEIQQQCITLFEEKEKFIKSIDDKINSEKEYITHLKEMAKDVISLFC